MKFLVFSVLLAVAFSKNIPRQNDKIVEMITKHGYQVETSSATTQDGYILEIFRIPHGISKGQSSNLQRPAVLLMHGLMSSAEDFVIGGPTQGLAFQLADEGYDVYLGNSRGSAYGQQHTTLEANRDAAFWRFCWQEIGTKDLPAIIDKVRSQSQQDKIMYVGHMEGATAFYVLASERPEYNQKVEKMVAMGPIAYMQKSAHPVLKTISNNYNTKSWVIKNLGMNTFRPSSELMENLHTECVNAQQDNQDICKNVYFLFAGFNSHHLNQTTVKQVLSRVPYGGSVREVIHLAQLVQSGRFESLSLEQNQIESHEYDLSKVAVPVAIFYAPEDVLSHMDDVKTLIEKLPNVYQKQVVREFTNNLDMIYARNVASFYGDVIKSLERRHESQSNESNESRSL